MQPQREHAYTDTDNTITGPGCQPSGHEGAADGTTSGPMLTIGQFCLNIIMEIILAAGLSATHINCLNTDTLIPH